MPHTIIVVPCFNEESRLPAEEFGRFLETTADVDLLFVDDGSTDATLERFSSLARGNPARISALDHGPNRGKAEAVRAGLREAFRREPCYAGFWDADLSTPLEELPRFVELLEERASCQAVFGSRVRLMGRWIERNALRHYAGRVFATLTSLTLGLPVYDTQCGAKLFRCTPEIMALFDEPFLTRWIFDVEIIARLIQAHAAGGAPDPHDAICEYPLRRWKDVPGSKVSPLDFFRGIRDLYRIHRTYLRHASRRA